MSRFEKECETLAKRCQLVKCREFCPDKNRDLTCPFKEKSCWQVTSDDWFQWLKGLVR